MYSDDVPILLPANLRLDPERAGMPRVLSAPPMMTGSEVSYLGRAPSGENQLVDGPCGIHALASLIEACDRSRIVDLERREAYKLALRKAGRVAGDGLTFPECVDAAIEIGWLPTGAMAVPCAASMILQRPLLGAYRVNECLDHAAANGVLNHTDAARRSRVRGYHAMTVLAYGYVGRDPKARWCGENSWGTGWGTHGLWTCHDDLHREICEDLYYVRGLEVAP